MCFHLGFYKTNALEIQRQGQLHRGKGFPILFQCSVSRTQGNAVFKLPLDWPTLNRTLKMPTRVFFPSEKWPCFILGTLLKSHLPPWCVPGWNTLYAIFWDPLFKTCRAPELINWMKCFYLKFKKILVNIFKNIKLYTLMGCRAIYKVLYIRFSIRFK